MYQNVLRARRAFVLAAAAGALCVLAARGASADPVKCQQAISDAGKKYEDARIKALQRCEDKKLKGKLPPDTDCAEEAKAADKIAKAKATLAAAVAKQCCGKDKTCGNSDDDALAGIGWASRVAACTDGERSGEYCQTIADCPKGCAGGSRAGQGCGADNQCPFNCQNAGTCNLATSTCVGGQFAGNTCANNTNCHGQCPVNAPTNPGGDCNAGSTCGNSTCVGSQTCSATPGKSECPNLESGACAGTCSTTKTQSCATDQDCPSGETCDRTLANAAQVATCLECAGTAGVDQLMALCYDAINPADATVNKKLETCKQTLGKEATKFFRAKRNALKVCEGAAIKAGSPAGTCPDAKATEKINKAKTKLTDLINKKCTGFTVAQIGAPLACPSVTIPGGAACGGFINTLTELANCLYCVSEFKADVLNALAAPANGPYPASNANPICGNGKIDTGETCDDGNLVDGDGCPQTCVIGACAAPTGTTPVTVTVTPPTGATLSAFTVWLEYPDTGSPNVRIPGQGNSAQVQGRITPADSNTSFTANDLDYALRLIVQSQDQTAITPTTFQVSLERCGSAPPATAYKCRVEAATGPAPTLAPVNGASCTVN